MNYFPFLLSSALLIGVGLLRSGPATPAATASRVPVVVELFTSEGCSSCPAADALLLELERIQPVPGAEIISLSEHVDYWNRLGWRDPFSAPAYTERQRAYAQQLGSGVYTPQAVVNGQQEMVGSKRAALLAAIAAAARAPRATVQATIASGTLRVQVSGAPAGRTAVLLALTETGLSTQVGRDENAGRLLRHPAVVRELRTLGEVGPAGTFAATPALPQNPQWQPANMRAVVLVQQLPSHRIVGVASVRLADNVVN